MFKKLFPLAAVAASLAMAVTAAQAGYTQYFGENLAPNEIATGDPATARANFLAHLASGVSTETFEGFAEFDSSPLALTFTGSSSSTIGATVVGAGEIAVTPSGVGRFNTTGAGSSATAGKWWDVSGTFTITFDTEIAAFGFYGTDIGDVNGQVTVAMYDGSDNLVRTQTIGSTSNSGDALLFWGFTDTNTSYKKLIFGNTNTGADFFGFDDMVVGDLGQLVEPPPVNRTPEPASLALVGLSLLGIAGARRRRN